MADPAINFLSFDERDSLVNGPSDSISLTLVIQDAEVLHHLRQYDDMERRNAFVLSALKIGVLALRQAQGHVDIETLRNEGQHLMTSLRQELSSKVIEIDKTVAGTLKTYFDPSSGSFTERVQRLIQKDGDLDRVLREKIGDGEESELARTLARRIGENSPLMRRLSPQDAEGVISQISLAVESILDSEKKDILAQFSLDSDSSALTRLVKEIKKQNLELSGNVTGAIDTAVREFSLDDENSALSRLVRQVESAQRRISDEFSQDNEFSAMSRMTANLAATRKSIDDNLTLDNENSALSLLSRQLNGILTDIQTKNESFQREMGATVASLVTRKKEAQRSTIHGNDFEDAFCSALRDHVDSSGDIFTAVGTRPGFLPNCKKGDATLEIGAESVAAGERIVFEAKEEKKYTFQQARTEIDEARKNREASIGVFVFSKETAPEGLQSFSRFDKDIFIVWDKDDATSDIYIEAAVSVARALLFRQISTQEKSTADLKAMDGSINLVEQQLSALDEIEKLGNTIQHSGKKVCEKATALKACITEEMKKLRNGLAAVRSDVADL